MPPHLAAGANSASERTAYGGIGLIVLCGWTIRLIFDLTAERLSDPVAEIRRIWIEHHIAASKFDYDVRSERPFTGDGSRCVRGRF